jgi:hypothetical protein
MFWQVAAQNTVFSVTICYQLQLLTVCVTLQRQTTHCKQGWAKNLQSADSKKHPFEVIAS